jgi:hypothetical protein
MIPLVVPRTMEADTARHVGDPKLRLPASEKAWPLSFFSLVQRTTSHGGDCVSVSAWSRMKVELMDTLRLWRKAGDEGRGLCKADDGDDIRDLKRRSNGRKDGVGLPMPGLEAVEGRMLLPGDEIIEPCNCANDEPVRQPSPPVSCAFEEKAFAGQYIPE